MACGPLRKDLYGSNLAPLTWKQRLEIRIWSCKGIALPSHRVQVVLIRSKIGSNTRCGTRHSTMLRARPTVNPAFPRVHVNIAEWAMKWQKKGHLEKVIDPHLVGHVNVESLRKFGETVEKCLAEHGSERPTMADVMWNLEYAVHLQEASMQSVMEENSTNNIPEHWIPAIELNGEGEEIVTDQESDATARSVVFLQIVDPR
ncbi:hypothetical protein RJ641_036125, partial [Dillenia turbinata]